MIVTAAMMRRIPRAIVPEIVSPKTTTPMTIAVSGSIAPRTEVSVEPILLIARTSERFDTSVGRKASSRRLTRAAPLGIACTPPLKDALMRKKPALDRRRRASAQIVHLADAADIIHRHEIDRIAEPPRAGPAGYLPAKRFLPLPPLPRSESSATPESARIIAIIVKGEGRCLKSTAIMSVTPTG